ncbi:MAG: DUF2480 family protein [Bacteroidia bacterium]|nr:DUF2480 family protein [Bacteroidia bacterium]
METTDSIVNRVANSGLITLNPADFYLPGQRTLFDIKPLLVEEYLLREKDFRAFVSNHNWQQYENHFVAITCTNDAIIATWAYMLIAAALAPFAKSTVVGSLETLETVLMLQAIEQMDVAIYKDQRLVIKGCADLPIPAAAYTALVSQLTPVAKSIMYGEPCSTVPVFKSK